jgi:hypothetical protein
VQQALRVQSFYKRQQVVLVGAAPVMEDEQASRLAGRRPLAVDE